MSDAAVKRDFVLVGNRRVHFRHAGSGAPAVLLHQSPRCSAEMVPLMRSLAAEFQVIAPDTPGFGHSEPLGPADAEPTIDAFVDALVGFFDALGLTRVALFGSHTGAIIATRLAARYPARVSVLIANGVLLTTPDERADMLDNYFPRFAPSWDGSHLTWLWARLRDQLVFYPWYRRQAKQRIEWVMSLAELDESAVDLLDAGDSYRGAYRAVLDYDIAPDLTRLQPNTCLMVARTDALSHFVPLYPPASTNLRIEVLDDFADIPAAVAANLRQHAEPAPVLQVPAVTRPLGLVSQMLHLRTTQWHVRCSARGPGRVLVVLHDLGRSAASLEALLTSLAGQRSVWAPDLPGHGLSDAGATTPAEMAELLLEALSLAGIETFDLIAEGASAAVALALRAKAPAHIHICVLCNPLAVSGDGDAGASAARSLLPPDLTPDSSGAHLLRAWAYLKDRDLYTPWHTRTPATATPQVAPARPAVLQQALIDLLRTRDCLPAQWMAALSTTSWAQLAVSGVVFAATHGSAAFSHLPGVVPLPVERVNWNWPLLDLFGT